METTESNAPENTSADWDGEFDADRAKNTITALRGEVKDWKAKFHSAEAERDNALANAASTKSEIDEIRATLQLATDEAETARKDYADLNALRTKENLLHSAGLSTEYVANIAGDDPEAWQASVESLAALRGDKSQKTRTPDPAQTSEPIVDERAEMAHQLFGD